MEEEEDVEILESEVRRLSKKVSYYRQTLPDHLLSAFSSNPPTISEVPLVLGTQEQDSEEKTIQLKERMSKNATNLPKVVKRVRQCIQVIDKLDSLDKTIHPAFTKRTTN